jgi:hypothetical protein
MGAILEFVVRGADSRRHHGFIRILPLKKELDKILYINHGRAGRGCLEPFGINSLFKSTSPAQ